MQGVLQVITVLEKYPITKETLEVSDKLSFDHTAVKQLCHEVLASCD
jgi:hypothetical protein